MIRLENNQVFSTDDKYVHRLGTDSYFRRSTTLPTDTVDDFEEVDELPAYTKAEYDAKVAELVRRKYSESEEFAIQRKMLNTLLSPMTLSEDAAENAVSEYAEYNEYVERCKADAPAAVVADKERERIDTDSAEIK